jgi:hypothetical protein
MTVEAGVVINKSGTPIHWHIPPNRSGGALPDSRDLWDVLWENRFDLEGFAHSHPGGGIPGPSHTDITTFAAVEAALGLRLTWWIISSEAAVTCTWCGPGKHDYSVKRTGYGSSWIPRLRELSGYPGV